MSMKRLLFIAHRMPFPPDKGERVRAFHEIVALSRHFRVTLATFAHSKQDHDAAGQLRQWCQEIIVLPTGPLGPLKAAMAILGGKSATEGYFSSSRGRRIIGRFADQPFDIAMGYCSSTLDLLMSAPAGARVMDLVDVDSVKWGSYAQQSGPPRRWLFAREAVTVRRLEERALAKCDAVLLVSEAEKRELAPSNDKLHAVGNGVDLDYFCPAPHGQARGASLVFTGTMSYRPNVEGVCWFAKEVWPALRKRAPQAQFAIVGRDPAPAVRRLADIDGISVSGSVADVRPYLHGASVAVAPLLTARGVQNKVLEAMACGLPVVGTPEAMEGLDVELGKDALAAHSPAQWVDALAGLLADEALRGRLGQSARTCVEKKYQWDAMTAPLVEMCIKLADARPVAALEASDR